MKELSATVWPLGRCDSPALLNQGQDLCAAGRERGYKAMKMASYGQNLTHGGRGKRAVLNIHL